MYVNKELPPHLGGHDNEVSAQEVADLTAAGYGANIT